MSACPPVVTLRRWQTLTILRPLRLQNVQGGTRRLAVPEPGRMNAMITIPAQAWTCQPCLHWPALPDHPPRAGSRHRSLEISQLKSRSPLACRAPTLLTALESTAIRQRRSHIKILPQT